MYSRYQRLEWRRADIPVTLCGTPAQQVSASCGPQGHGAQPRPWQVQPSLRLVICVTINSPLPPLFFFCHRTPVNLRNSCVLKSRVWKIPMKRILVYKSAMKLRLVEQSHRSRPKRAHLSTWSDLLHDLASLGSVGNLYDKLSRAEKHLIPVSFFD